MKIEDLKMTEKLNKQRKPCKVNASEQESEGKKMGFEQLDEIMESQNPETAELDAVYTQIEQLTKMAEIREGVPGVELAVVTGYPEMAAGMLDSVQGDEIDGACGTCGLTSIANICRLAGENVSEGMVVSYAVENTLCNVAPWDAARTCGITGEQAVEIMSAFGIGAHVEKADACSIEELAEAVESGHGVIVGIDAGEIWDDPASSTIMFGKAYANHYVTITGVARDAATGEVAGFYICDSGRGLESDACRYLSAEKLERAYNTSIGGADAVITNAAIRRV